VSPLVRSFLLSCLFICGTMGSAEAQGQKFTSPDDVLSSLYEMYLWGGSVRNFGPFFSDRLTEELRGGRIDSDALGKLGFDPITGTTSPRLLTTFHLKGVNQTATEATTVATFSNNGIPVTITFELIYEPANGWQIDHLSGTAGDVEWCSGTFVKAVQASSGAH